MVFFPMQLDNLIEPHLDLPRLSQVLDELGHPGRVWVTRQWDLATQAKLYEAIKGFRPLKLEDFVPDSVPPLTEVIHHGKNSLPTFTLFQKRFCRPADAEAAAQGLLFGYNHQAMAAFTGPGYFVTHSGTDGEIDIDYTMDAKERAPSWPEIEKSGARLGKVVYAGMIDVMRGLSSHVTIGRAKRGGEFADNWFVLVREDVPNSAG